MRRRSKLRSLVLGAFGSLLSIGFLAAVMIPQQAEAANDIPWQDSALSVTRANGGFVSGLFSALLPVSPANSDFTVEVWATQTGVLAGNTRYPLWSLSDKSLYIYNGNFYWQHDTGSTFDTGVAAPQSNEWFHAAIVGVNSTKTIKLVLNGSSTSWSRTFTTLSYSGSSFVGGDGSSGNYNSWNGLIDQFKVYKSALTDAQIAQSMNSYANIGVSNTPALAHHISFNDRRPTSQYTDFGLYNLGSVPSSGITFTYVDVKTVDTTSRPGKTIYKFPRSYLTTQGGWLPSSGFAATYEYLVVAGGGGGGGNRGGGGGAGGLLTGSVLLPYNAGFQVVVGAGGYSAQNGGGSFLKNLKGTSNLLSTTGGGAGGTHGGVVNGADGGSGGGASMCYSGNTPAGGAAASGQGFAGGSTSGPICPQTPTEARHTAGGGGSASAGSVGDGGSTSPTALTTPMTRPNGGAGTASSIGGNSTMFAAGGGGATALLATEVTNGSYVSSFAGAGGSSIGGDGATVGARGSHAAAGTGSGGGGGGNVGTNDLTSGGYGSTGVVYLVATPGPTLTVPAAGASLNAPTQIQPTVTVPTGTANITGCSAVDANGNSSGVTVTCTPVNSSSNSATLTDLTFTNGTTNAWYTVIYTINGFDQIRQEMYLGFIPETVEAVASGETSNFVWDGTSLLATSAGQVVKVLATDVSSRVNAASIALLANTKVTISSAITATTTGNGITFKAKSFEVAKNITTQNGAITFWSTNANSPTGTTGITGLTITASSGSQTTIQSNGGNVTIGGGTNPLTQPITAEVGLRMTNYAKIFASGGNISIRANSVLNSSLNTSDFQMGGMKMDGVNEVGTTGAGNIAITVNGDGTSDGRIAYGLLIWSTTNKITTTGGNITVTAGNLGSGNVQPFQMETSNEITTTGSGNISITGDGRGTTTSATAAPSQGMYGIGVGLASSGSSPTGSYNKIQTENGNITLLGYGGSHQSRSTVVSNSGSTGVLLNNQTLKSTGSGSIDVRGYGGSISQNGTILEISRGLRNTGHVNTNSGSINIIGVAGVVSGTASSSAHGIVLEKGNLSDSYSPGIISSTSGNVTLNGDTLGAPAGTTAVYEYGIYQNLGHKITSTSGSVSITGTVCSTCVAGADYGNSSMGIFWANFLSGATVFNQISAGGSGNVTVVGRVDNRNDASGSFNRGIQLSHNGSGVNLVSTDSGNVTMVGSVGGAGGQGMVLSNLRVNSNSGTVTVTGTSTSSKGFSSNGGAFLSSTTIKTLTGAINLTGENTATPAPGTMANSDGLNMVTSNIQSGDSTTTPTATTGGTVTVIGRVPEDTAGVLRGIYVEGSQFDSYNGAVNVTANAASTVANGTRTGMFANSTQSTFAATAASLNLKVYGSGSTSGALVQNCYLNFGGSSSQANITIEVDGWNFDVGTTVRQSFFDTSGWIEILPIGTSFKPSNRNQSSATSIMDVIWSPTTRISKFTIGKPGNTRPLTFSSSFGLSTDASNLAIGNLVIHAGTVDAGASQIKANTLSVNSSGEVKLGISSSNEFNRVAIVRGSATGFAVNNSVSSWEAGTFNGVTGVYGVPTKLKFSTTQPTSTPAGTATSFSVRAADAYDINISTANTRSQDAISVTASKVTGASSTLGGTLTRSGTAGAPITFSDISFDQKGNHTIAFDAAGYTQLVSSNINVTNGPPTYSLSYFSGTNSTTFSSSSTTASPSLTTATTGVKTWTVPVGASVCSVNSSGVVTTLSAGTCDIRLATAADSNYAASSVTVTLTIQKSNQALLTISTTSGTYGSPLTLSTGSSGSGTGAVTYVVDSGTCSLSGATLTLGNAGESCMVTASKAEDASFNAATSASTAIVTNKASQASLTAPVGLTMTYADTNGLSMNSLTIGGGSGSGAITFATPTTGCQIVSDILTSTNNAGTACSVTVTKATDSNYLVATVSFSVAITRANQALLTITSTTGTYGQVLALTTSGGTDTGAVSYSVNSGTCVVSGANLTLGNAASDCYVTATKAQTTNYNATSSQSVQITIAKASQTSITITSSNSFEYAATLALTASGGSGTSVGYSFSTVTPGCAISGSTLSSTLGATNTCVISAYKVGDANFFDSASVQQTVTITKASQVSAMTVPSGVTLGYGNLAGLDLSGLSYTGGDGTGAWTFSTSTSGCTITGNTLTSTNNASTVCSISVVKAADANYNASTPQVMSVTIAKANQAALTITTLNVTYLSTLSLSASGGTTNGVVTFAKVSGTCTISGSVLTPTGAGSCVVTATMAGSTNYNNVVSADTTVTIAKANQTALNWNLTSTSVPYLGSLTLATTGGSGTGAVVFTVSQGSSCSVGGNVLMPSDAGSICEVIATKVADSNYNSADTSTQVITVTKISQASISFSNANSITYGQTLDLFAIGGSGSGAISYSVSNSGSTGCSLTGNTLAVVGAGTCVVSATKASSTNYLAGSAVTQSITVNKASQTVAFTSVVPANPIVGDTYALTSLSSSGTPTTFAIGTGGCSITGATVTFTGAGLCRIDASLASTSQYLASSVVSQSITVGQQNQTITFGAATLNLATKTFGDPAFAVTATSSVAALTPAFSRGSNTTNNACLVSTSGLVTVVAVGVCEIQADQIGDADTAAASTIYKSFSVVADIANAPTIVSVSSGHQSITVAFVKPSYTGGATISGYQLVATHAGGTVTTNTCSVVAGTDQSCTISGLTNGTAYTVKVAAINSAGVGLQSAPSASRVPATNPAAVSAFTAVPDDTRLVLSWQNPISLGGGTFDSYRIFIKRSSDLTYPMSYITVGSQSTLTYTVTGLINGESYDAKIVTVTTANTLALESNTAEARETPRTVPDAPATILVFEVGANLVISWTSPVFDGGNAVSEFLATVSGATCTMATPLDTTCVVTKPSAAGAHPIEVKARNAAGFGPAISSQFTVASAQSSGGNYSNGGNDSVTPNKPQMRVISFSVGTIDARGGQVLKVLAENMEGITEVLVDGIPAKILGKSATVVQILMPKHKNGKVTITFVGPNGRLEVPEAVSYVGGSVKRITTTFKNYIQEVSTLSVKTKKSLKALVSGRPGLVSVTCVGYQSWSYDTPLDAFVAKERARVACDYIKSINKKLKTSVKVARTTLVGPPSRKLVVQVTQAY